MCAMPRLLDGVERGPAAGGVGSHVNLQLGQELRRRRDVSHPARPRVCLRVQVASFSRWIARLSRA